MEEIWRDIEGYEGLYQASNLSRIRSLDKWVYRRNKPPFLWMGNIMKQTLRNPKSYYCCNLHKNKKQKIYYIHVLVAKAFIPNPLNLPQINHIDGNRLNNALENLEWCTAKYNMNHAFQTGLRKPPRGEKHCHAKLTIEAVRDIFATPKFYGVIAFLAKKYNVDGSSISGVRSGRTWKHINN